MRTAAVVLLGLAFADCGGKPFRAEPWLRLPVSTRVGDAFDYTLAWKKTAARGENEHGELAWSAELTLRVLAAEGAGSRWEVRIHPREEGGEARTFTFRMAPDGRVDDVVGFVDPSGYQVKVGGIGAGDVVSPAAWVQARLRPLPKASLDEGEVWVLADGTDGLPLPLGLRLDLRVVDRDADRIVVAGTGDVVVPPADERAAHLVRWVTAADKEVTASYVLSRTDGLVLRGEVTLTMEADRPWTLDPAEEALGEAKHTVTRGVLRIERH